MEKMIRQQVNFDEVQFSFMPEFRTNKRHFYLETVIGEIFSRKEEFALCICRCGENF